MKKKHISQYALIHNYKFSTGQLDRIRKNMNIAPTLTVRPGFRINVMVTKDITVTGVYKDYVY